MELFPFFISPKYSEVLASEEPILSLSEEEICEIEKLIEKLDCELCGNQPGRNLHSFIIFMEILTFLGRKGKHARKPEDFSEVQAALSHLNMHFREPVSISHLAKISNLSKRSFFRHFKGFTGMTPVEYCRRKQLEYAADMLRSTNLTIAEIAVECGFCDSNYLIKLFSKVVGKTPGKFRRENR